MNTREEGDTCGADGCEGKMHYRPVENCSCHISPPCSGCADNPLICDACLYSEAELDSMGESKPSGEGET